MARDKEREDDSWNTKQRYGKGIVAKSNVVPWRARGDHRPAAVRTGVQASHIFFAFLAIGATSFGGGAIGYVRNMVVTTRGWLDDDQFVELLSIGQPLPGLKVTNLAVLIGDRLAGISGALAAITGLCLPGALLMCAVGLAYQVERDRPFVTAALEGVAPAALGILAATVLGLSRKSMSRFDDLVFVALTVVGVNRLHLPVPVVLICVGATAIAWYGTRASRNRP